MPGKKTSTKAKARKKTGEPIERKLVLRDDDSHVYAKVIKAYGSGRFEVSLVRYIEEKPILSDTSVMAILPGRMKKQKWKHFVSASDFVLVSIRSFEEGKVDILHKYDQSHVQQLKGLNEIPDTDCGQDAHCDNGFITEDAPINKTPKSTISTIAEEESQDVSWEVDYAAI